MNFCGLELATNTQLHWEQVLIAYSPCLFFFFFHLNVDNPFLSRAGELLSEFISFHSGPLSSLATSLNGKQPVFPLGIFFTWLMSGRCWTQILIKFIKKPFDPLFSSKHYLCVLRFWFFYSCCLLVFFYSCCLLIFLIAIY